MGFSWNDTIGQVILPSYSKAALTQKWKIVKLKTKCMLTLNITEKIRLDFYFISFSRSCSWQKFGKQIIVGCGVCFWKMMPCMICLILIFRFCEPQVDWAFALSHITPTFFRVCHMCPSGAAHQPGTARLCCMFGNGSALSVEFVFMDVPYLRSFYLEELYLWNFRIWKCHICGIFIFGSTSSLEFVMKLVCVVIIVMYFFGRSMRVWSRTGTASARRRIPSASGHPHHSQRRSNVKGNILEIWLVIQEQKHLIITYSKLLSHQRN